LKKLKDGDIVKVKSLAWYNKNKNKDGKVRIGPTFVKEMADFCGKKVTIRSFVEKTKLFRITEDSYGYCWSTDFIETEEQLELDFGENK
jgi:hypothetical protein